MNQNDFKEFMNSSVQPPAAVDQHLRKIIHLRLNPGLTKTMIKLALTHLLIAPISLLICPQFGFSLTSSMGLVHWFSQFGDEACTLACGGTYMAMTLIAVSLFFTPEQLRLVRRSRSFQMLFLTGLSLGFFVCLGATVFLNMTVWWVAGAIIGGSLVLEVGVRLKTRLS